MLNLFHPNKIVIIYLQAEHKQQWLYCLKAFDVGKESDVRGQKA